MCTCSPRTQTSRRPSTEPAIDFWQGTYLTLNVLEAARIAGARRITYTSGSGVYGDRGDEEVDEDFGPLIPASTYGASKLGCEALIAAYVHMFGIDAVAFRFANVVGDGQTHGVTYDFVRRLNDDPTRLRILGDGRQSKSYIHVSDVVVSDADAQRARLEGIRCVQRGHRRIHHGHGDRGARVRADGAARRPLRIHRRCARLARATYPSCASAATSSPPWDGAASYSSIDALRDSIDANIAEAALGSAL